MSRLDKGGLASQIRNENFDEGSPRVPLSARSLTHTALKTEALEFANSI
jgi:hypothetical protein